MGNVVDLFDTLREDAAGAIGGGENRGGDSFGAARPGGWGREHLGRQLAMLLKRDRIRLVRRLVRLLNAAAQAGVDPAELLYGQSAPAGFKALFCGAPGDPRVVIQSRSIVHTLADDRPFDTAFNAMGGLACAFQLLEHFLGFERCWDHVDAIAATDDAQELETIARAWADDFDGYRRARIGSESERRFFQAVRGFLSDGDGDCDINDVNSRNALEFWLARACDEDIDAVCYQTVHSHFQSFAEAWSAHLARRQAGRSADIGDEDWRAGGDAVSPGGGHDAVGHLMDSLPESKLLIGRHARAISPLLGSPGAEKLLLSALREATFAPLENRAIRHKARGGFDDAWREGEADSYAAMLAGLDAALAELRRAARAMAHVLIQGGREEGVLLLLRVADDDPSWIVSYAQEKGLDESDLTEDGGSRLGLALVEDVCAGADLPDPCRRLLAGARDAYGKIDRGLLRGDRAADSGALDALDLLAVHLPEAIAFLERRRDLMIAATGAGPEEKFAADRPIFLTKFRELHAAAADGG